MIRWSENIAWRGNFCTSAWIFTRRNNPVEFYGNHESNHGRNLQEGEGKTDNAIKKVSSPSPRSTNKPSAAHNNQGKTKAFTVQQADGNKAKKDDGTPGTKLAKQKRKRAPKLHIAAAYEDPKPIKCVLCKGGEHTHIYYCPEFAKSLDWPQVIMRTVFSVALTKPGGTVYHHQTH